MLAPQPRVAGIEYRIAYGLTLFNCDGLHASLSPTACSDNFINRRCFACHNCSIGRTHAGKAPQSAPEPAHRSGECVRCGRQDVRRQIGSTHCMSCYNREREVLRGVNRKGQWPRVSAARLHRCQAILAGTDLLGKFRLASHFQYSQPEFPHLTEDAPGRFVLTAIVTGIDELNRLLARRLPGATIVESTISPSFSECRQS
jgi:hypothetical protein